MFQNISNAEILLLHMAWISAASAVRRLWHLFVLLVFFAGCSGYRTAAIPGQQDSGDKPAIEVGMPAQIRLKDGGTVAGDICAITETTVTVATAGNFGRESQEITFAKIERVEVQASTETGSTAASLFGTVAIACASLIVLFLAFGDVK